MPFESQAQAKWAFATKQPWARKWGKLTRAQGGIARLPQYVTRKNRKWGKRKLLTQKEVPSATPALGNASGPGGLFSASGLEKGMTPANTVPNRPFVRRKHASFRGRTRRNRAQITVKELGNTGAMVALFLPAPQAVQVGDAAKGLFGDKAECPCDLHITLAYLGKMVDIEPLLPQVAAACQRYVQFWLSTMGAPLEITLGGYSAFDNPSDDGMIPIYREVSGAAIFVFVDGLKRVLDMVGITNHRDFEPYTPHVTVAYTYPELQELLPTAPATPVQIGFDYVTMAFGDLQICLPMSLASYKAVGGSKGGIKVANTPTPVAPSGSSSSGGGGTPGEQLAPGVVRIHGNLCQVHGKFGPCDSANSSGFNAKPKKAKGGKGGKGGRGGGKAKLTDQQKADQKQQADAAKAQQQTLQKAQNRTAALGAMSNRPNDNAMGVLDGLRQGAAVDEALAKSMESTGLIAKHSDGSHTLSASGHAFLNALEKGDAGAANEALAGAGDKVASAATHAQQQAAAAQAKQDRAAAMAKRNAARTQRQAQRAAGKPGKANLSSPTSSKKPTKPSKSRSRNTKPSGAIPSRTSRTLAPTTTTPRNESLEIAT